MFVVLAKFKTLSTTVIALGTVCHDKRFVMGHAPNMIVRVVPFRFPELLML